MYLTCTIPGGTLRNSCCGAQFCKTWRYLGPKMSFWDPFSDQTFKIHTRFQTWPLGISNSHISISFFFVFFFVGFESSRSGLKSECADIFHQSFLWLLRHTDEPQRGRNNCLWLQSRSVLSSFGVVLMSCRVNFHVVRSALQWSACRI